MDSSTYAQLLEAISNLSDEECQVVTAYVLILQTQRSQ